MLSLKPIHKITCSEFISERHYSAVMPRLTKHFMGCYQNDELVGAITFGWGTRPKHTIQKLFPELDTKDYFEIGKMCMDDSMPKNSESQLLSLSIKWLRKNTDIKYLFTWADGLVGKPGYVYQAANFLYGGFSMTDTYVSENGEKIHPRTIQGILPNEDGLKYGHRPNPQQLVELKLSRVKGKQFRYIYPMSKKDRKYLKKSTVKWDLNHPKHSDLEWKIKPPGEKDYTQTKKMPFDLTKDMEYNKKNIQSYKSESNLNSFFN
tara:strand:+ start:2161 stop:2949 length:789 start_codon:yes stop_codon:yes gene_type:complete